MKSPQTIPALSMIMAALTLPLMLSSAELTLTWTDNSSNEEGFEIWRRPVAETIPFEQVAVVGEDATTFTDVGLELDATYTYKVRAWNSFGVSGFTNEATGTAREKLTGSPPSAPTDAEAKSPAPPYKPIILQMGLFNNVQTAP